MKQIISFFSKIAHYLDNSEQRRVEAYLSTSSTLAELEQRMRNLQYPY